MISILLVMNTVKIGDKFEDKSYKLIEKAINNGELNVLPSCAKIYRKKGYYSDKRKKEIIFDLSIEIWSPNAKRYTFLFLIECKSSTSKKVPVDDIEEFYSKIDQVAGKNVKGIMISDCSFQKGTITFAENTGLMLIEVDKNSDNHSIILHRTEKNKTKPKVIEDIVYSFLQKTLGNQTIIGLQRLSTKQIEEHADSIRCQYNKDSCIHLPSLIKQLEQTYDLRFNFEANLEHVNGKKIEGYFDIRNNIIFIDKELVDTERFPFILGHELGHFFLHRNLQINQEQYNDFEDSEYDFFADRYIAKNDKNWVEWQANRFAVAFFLPKKIFITQMVKHRYLQGISRPNQIFLDHQEINQRDYYETVRYLSEYFNISKTSVKYRLEELHLITYLSTREDITSQMRQLLNALLQSRPEPDFL